MNGPAALLVLACMLFAAVWRADEPGRRADTRTAFRRYVGQVAIASRSEQPVVAPTTPEPGVEPTTVVAETSESIEVSEAVVVPVDLPLPVDITAGEYRVVGDQGEVRELVLTAGDLEDFGMPTVIEPRASYVVEAEGVTWYYVRVVPRVVATPTVEVETSEVTPVDSTDSAEWSWQDVLGRSLSRVRSTAVRSWTWTAGLVDRIRS